MGKKEETKGNREGWRVIISLQFSLGCRRGGWPHPGYCPSAGAGGGQSGSFTSREAAALRGVLMPVDPGTRKGPSKGIFKIHLQTVSLFILLHHEVLFGAFGLEVCFHPTGGTFLWELDGRDRRKESHSPSMCCSPTPPLPKSANNILTLPRARA